MTTHKEWEKEYDIQFGNLGNYRSDELNILNFDAEKLLAIKSFISSLLTHEREEMRKEIKGLKLKDFNDRHEWNGAIAAVLELLDKQK